MTGFLDRLPATMGSALNDIFVERQRQIEVEGWTPEHDDAHEQGALAIAGGWYAINADSHNWIDVMGVAGRPDSSSKISAAFNEVNGYYAWPFGLEWWKPKNTRNDLVRAAALIVAEIERIDRAAAKTIT